MVMNMSLSETKLSLFLAIFLITLILDMMLDTEGKISFLLIVLLLVGALFAIALGAI